MKKVIVIGSGAGGAVVAKELQGNFQVDILEAGKPFLPFPFDLEVLEKLRKTRFFFDERMIQLLFPPMKVNKLGDQMVFVSGKGLGGTTTISAGNALRADECLKEIGIDLDEEFTSLHKEISVVSSHENRWRDSTKKLFEISTAMGLEPKPAPKMIDFNSCTGCGQCVLGCPQNAKWDSSRFIDISVANGAHLVTSCKAVQLEIEKEKVSGVWVKERGRKKLINGDIFVLAAGGIGTPSLLENSGIVCEERLFVDPVLCVAAYGENVRQNREISMPFIIQRKNYIISPYFDHLSFFFNKQWLKPAGNMYGLMIKLADTNKGSVKGKLIDKSLTVMDKGILQEGVSLCKEILEKAGFIRRILF